MHLECLKCGTSVDFGPVTTAEGVAGAQESFRREHECRTPIAYLSEVLRIIRHGREGSVEELAAYADLLADKLAADGYEREADRIRKHAAGDYGAQVRLHGAAPGVE